MAERDEAIRAGHGGYGTEAEVPRIASGIHSEDSVIDVESRVPTEPSVGASEPQSDSPNAVITPDGIQELPPWLIGSDGKTFTVRHDVAVCGHKVDRINQPKRNCHVCWWAFFQTHEMLVKTAHEFYQQFGKERLVAMRGRVFVKYFLMFMSTVQHILEQQKKEEECRIVEQPKSNEKSDVPTIEQIETEFLNASGTITGGTPIG